MKKIASVLVFGVCLFFVGCGSSDSLNRQAVTGEIQFEGSPIPEGTIEFSPVGEGTSSGAVIQEGKFSIPEEKGLPPGEYLVRISAYNPDAEPVAMPGESNNVAEEIIPPKYNTESDVKFTVEAGAENVFTLNIE
ncbi:MAG: carboxypeptidase regulatory-like domain-containing protein [Planctomycetaceae bacterium]|nr:carboxypeptidase regulatory-like domain-containing protein [Planctomycetaceae bacterium]